ncbi:MAG TPA: HTH domain-containing protein [Streptosporangiaceae bacterium]|jgi:predicted DNA-binding transcriptional regulator YafY
MRASRLVQLLSLLQDHGRLTTRQLSAQLEVSQRTVLRDIEALSSAGVPVYGVRGRQGGFELIEGSTRDLSSARLTVKPAAPATARARIWLSPRGRRLAVLLGRPAGLKIRKSPLARPGRDGWLQAWIPVESPEATVLDILALGAEAELIAPPELRARVRDTADRIARLHNES